MKIVVDTNIVFSSLLNSNGKISDLLLNSSNSFEFYSPSYLVDELENHRKKLKKISGFSDKDLDYLQRNIFKKIDLLDLESVRESTWEKRLNLRKVLMNLMHLLLRYRLN